MITKIRQWLFAGLLCLALWPGAAGGQSSELKAAYKQFNHLYAQGRYQEAIPFAEEAVRLGEEEFGPDHPTTATLLNNLAELFRLQGRYAEAEPLHNRALAIRETALGPEHPDLATSLNNLAGLYYFEGRYAEAEPLYRRALAIREKALGPEASGCGQQPQQPGGAVPNSTTNTPRPSSSTSGALAIRETALGPEHLDLATKPQQSCAALRGPGPVRRGRAALSARADDP